MPYLFLIHERRFGFMLGGHFKVAMKTIWLLLLPALMLAPMAIWAAIAEPPGARCLEVRQGEGTGHRSAIRAIRRQQSAARGNPKEAVSGSWMRRGALVRANGEG